MHIRDVVGGLVVTTLLILGSSCATNEGSSSSASSRRPSGPGHYVLLPASTGSNIPRRVWVSDEDATNAVTTIKNPEVQTVSPAAFENVRQRSGSNWRSGN